MAGRPVGKVTIWVVLRDSLLRKGVKGTTHAMVQANRASKQLRLEMNALQRQVNRTTRTFAPFIALFGALESVRSVVQFELELSRVEAIAGVTGAKMEALQSMIRHLGATTQYTSTQVGEAATALARAGFSASEAYHALKGTIDLAIIGTLEMGDAARYTSNMIRAFQLEASESVRVTDVLSKAANIANHTIPEIGDAMRHVAGIAASLNYTLEDTAAGIALLANMGIKGEQAGTNIKQMFIKLGTPSREAQKALADMGLTVRDVSPDFNGFLDILRNIAAGVERTEEPFSKLATIFGARASIGALLFSNNMGRLYDNIQKVEEAMRSQGAYSTKLARIMQNNLYGALKRVLSAFQELIITILMGKPGETGETLAERLRDSLDSLARGINWLSWNLDKVYVGAVAFLALWKGAALERITGSLLAIAKGGTMLAGAFGMLKGALLFLGRFFLVGVVIEGLIFIYDLVKAATDATRTWTQVFKDFGKSLLNMVKFTAQLAGSIVTVLGTLVVGVFAAIGGGILGWMEYRIKLTGHMFRVYLVDPLYHMFGELFEWLKVQWGKLPWTEAYKAQDFPFPKHSAEFLEYLERGVDDAINKGAEAGFQNALQHGEAIMAKIWGGNPLGGPLGMPGGSGAGVGDDPSAVGDKGFFASLGGNFMTAVKQAADAAKTLGEQLFDIARKFSDGLADGFARALVLGESLKDIMASLWQQTILSIAKMVVKWLMFHAIRLATGNVQLASALTGIKAETAAKLAGITATTTAGVAGAGAVTAATLAGGAATTTAAVASAGAVTAANAPAAVASGIGSWGTTLVFGAIALAAIAAAASAFAQGGMVRGRGTGTSDSVPAWLSAGEFVVPAAATKRSRRLLEEVRRGGIDDAALAAMQGGGGVSVGRSRLLDDVPDARAARMQVDVGGPRIDGRRITRALNESAVRQLGEGYLPRVRSLA